MKWYIPVILSLLLAGCGTVTGAKITATSATVKALVVKTIDAKMNTSRGFVCNNTYRAEMTARSRWGVAGASWNDFCGRSDGAGR